MNALSNSENSSVSLDRQTKIVATIGTVSDSKEMLTTLVQNGVNVIRLNMSHGEHAEHAAKITRLREVNTHLGTHTAILVDLAGPKIRIGDIATDTIRLIPGKKITLTTKKVLGTDSCVYINYPKLPQEVKKGNVIMLNDGKQKLVVQSVSKDEVHCIIEVGGDIRGRRGVNVPGAYLSVSAITPKDKKDIEFALLHQADFIAISFVRTAQDIEVLRKIIKKDLWQPRIIAKIETQEAIENFEEILEHVDGVMVARGDLAVEVPKEQVPILQKKIIRRANECGKFVITATQMLSSMCTSPVPTRAEVSDVANAIFDGTDAVMLSEETAVGDYPAEAVRTMRSICEVTDSADDLHTSFAQFDHAHHATQKAAVELAQTLDAKAIIALTETGSTPFIISRFRSHLPIIALSDKPGLNFLSLAHGVSVLFHEPIADISQLRESIREVSQQHGIAEKGDRVVIISGLTFGTTGHSNMLFVEKI